MSEAALEEIRRHSRTNTMLAATIEFGGVSRDVFVRNLSVAGAMLEGKTLPEPGQSVVLNRSDYRIPATV
ncbi:PilZ domain-containing protein, partial [Salmonella enterica]|uniref:PilZ domain-containing protein n=1 Tax=Salmonella enterica TaxID=28901 RepID=UPI0020A420B3